jgi:hypothetical protein
VRWATAVRRAVLCRFIAATREMGKCAMEEVEDGGGQEIEGGYNGHFNCLFNTLR